MFLHPTPNIWRPTPNLQIGGAPEVPMHVGRKDTLNEVGGALTFFFVGRCVDLGWGARMGVFRSCSPFLLNKRIPDLAFHRLKTGYLFVFM